MKCAFCLIVCATLISVGSCLPVTAGELNAGLGDQPSFGGVISIVSSRHTPASDHSVLTVREFNQLLDAGEFERAELLAKERFLKDSSDPLTVLMLRQAILSRKTQSLSIVFPHTTTKSRVIIPPAGINHFEPQAIPDPFADVVVRGETKPNPFKKQGSSHSTPITAKSRVPGRVHFNVEFGLNSQLVQSAQKSCAGSCLDALTAYGAPGALKSTAPSSIPRSSATAPTLPFVAEALTPRGVESKASDEFWKSLDEYEFVKVPADPADFEEPAPESTLTFYLIKGPVNDLDRLGIAIQSDSADELSQPKLNAAKAALPTPMTVPVLAPATSRKSTSVVSSIVPLTTPTPGKPDLELSLAADRVQEPVIRPQGEPLATRRLSAEERQEILKAAQAAERISITVLPKLTLAGDQQAELSSSILDSAGKQLELSLQAGINAEQKEVSLDLKFYSTQGPMVLSQVIKVGDTLHSDEALLIALDAPSNPSQPIAGIRGDQYTSYLVVSPSLKVPVPAKIASKAKPKAEHSRVNRDLLAVPKLEVMTQPSQIHRVAAEQSQDDLSLVRYSTRVYPVADLVVPIPDFVTVAINDERNAGPEVAPENKIDFKPLIQVITNTISPNEWEEVGGGGSIRPFETTLSLVIRQSDSVHQQIEELITTLRHELDVQGSLEIHHISGNVKSLADAGIAISRQDVMLTEAELKSRVSLSDCSTCPQIQGEFATESNDECPIATAFDFVLDNSKTLNPCHALLKELNLFQNLDLDLDCCRDKVTDDSQSMRLVKLLTEAQKEFLLSELHQRKDCMDLLSPKVTHFNNQAVSINFGELGTYQFQTRIAPNHREMLIRINPDNSQSGNSKAGDFQGLLRTGETVLVAIPQKKVGSTKIANKSNDDAVSYLMITPRVVIVEDEEVRKPVN